MQEPLKSYGEVHNEKEQEIIQWQNEIEITKQDLKEVQNSSQIEKVE